MRPGATRSPIRRRSFPASDSTGTLLAAHALVASFLGGATIRAKGLDALGSIALASLVLGLVVAAALRLRGG